MDRPREGIHTFGMKFAIDVLFLGREKKVLKARPGTQAGDVLEFERTD